MRASRSSRAGAASAALAVVIALLGAATARATEWSAVTGSTSSIQEVGKLRTSDGVLHVVWTRNTPGSSANTMDVLHVAISPAGAVGKPTVIASAYSTAENPALVATPAGLQVFFGAIQCTSGCPIGMFTSTSRDGGGSWTTPTLVLNSDAAYAAPMSAATLPDGTPFQTWNSIVHRGADSSSPDFDFHTTQGAGCCAYNSNLAADSAGALDVAWDSNASGFEGVWAQSVDPATGAPIGSPSRLPGSVTTVGGQAQHSQMLGRTPVVSLPGSPGAFFVAYPGGWPSTTKVLLWLVGSAAAADVADDPACDHHAVSLAADAHSRLWVFWSCSAGATHIFARRVGAAGNERAVDLGAPPGANTVYALDGDVGTSGDPEVLALTGGASGLQGTYFTRGPQTAPVAPPQNGKSVDVLPVSGTVLVRAPGQPAFAPLGAGQRLATGTAVDVTHGRVRLLSARTGRGTQSGDFSGGIFVVQQRRGAVLTTLRLTGGASCAGAAPDHTVAGTARKRRYRYLTASTNGRASFRTQGRYAAATVRGTVWRTEDYCDGTLVSVQRGTVSVADLVRHRTLLVRAGHSYFAAARGG